MLHILKLLLIKHANNIVFVNCESVLDILLQLQLGNVICWPIPQYYCGLMFSRARILLYRKNYVHVYAHAY